MSITIKDIAKKAGVSASTVSRVLNNDSKISGQTKERVKEVANQLGYRVNFMARGLKTNKTYTIGFICPEITNEFFMKVAKGVEQELKKHNYSMIICNSNENMEDEKKSIRILLDKSVDGIIAIPVSNEGKHFKQQCENVVPVVLVDRLADNFDTDAVLVNNEKSSFEMVDTFIKQGRKRIAFIGGNAIITSAKERFSGYLKALKENDIQVDSNLIEFGDFYAQSGYKIMRKFMALSYPPSDFFISNYFMQVGAVKFLQEHRDKIKAPISIASFDDLDVSPMLEFSKLFAAQPMVKIGNAASKLILKRIDGNFLNFPEIIRFDTKLVIR